MNIKIMTVTHKEYIMPKCDIYFPVCVGSGKDNLRKKYQTDDEGDNISEKNPHYCELTALYWAWKNLQCDIFGLTHYRRFFVKNKKSLENVIDEETIGDYIKQYDAIVAKKRIYPETLKIHYIKSQKNQINEARRQIEILGETVRDLSPEYEDIFNKQMNGHKAHMFNMFVMKKQDVDMFCEWMFGILFEAEKRIWNEGVQHERIMGGLSEFLLDVWLIKNNKKVVEFKVFDSGYSLIKKIRFVLFRRLFGKVVK